MWKPSPPIPEAIDAVTRVIKGWQSSPTTSQICGAIRGLHDWEINDALVYLRDNGTIACASGRWYMRPRKLVSLKVE